MDEQDSTQMGTDEDGEERVRIEILGLSRLFPSEPWGDRLRMPPRYTATFENPNWPFVEMDISVSNGEISMERVEFKRREDGPRLLVSDLRKPPLEAMLRATIPRVAAEVTVHHVVQEGPKKGRTIWGVSPLGTDEDAVEAVLIQGKRGAHIAHARQDARARVAFAAMEEAKEQDVKPAIDHVRQALKKEQGLKDPPSRQTAWRLAARGRDLAEEEKGAR